MSVSDPRGTVRLLAEASDPLTEITIIDDRFLRVGRGLGRAEAELPPGLYKVKFKTGSMIAEEFAALAPGSGTVTVSAPEMQFSAPAPLSNTRTSHEYQQEPAAVESRVVHERLGGGSQLYLFARDVTPTGHDPAVGLSLHSLAGELLIDFEQAGPRLPGDGWAACNLDLDPGAYLLRLRTGVEGTLEQTVVASPGWQTQLFLLRRSYGTRRKARRADLANASVFMARPGHGFYPSTPDKRWTELARQALAGSRAGVPKGDLDLMLRGKFENPMLGIYSGHLLLLEPEPDRRLLEIVLGNLAHLLGPHPDAAAIELGLAQATGERAGVPPYEAPPMLRRSWQIVARASAEQPELVPPGSLCAAIADRLRGEGAWLVWQQPRRRAGARRDFTDLENLLPKLAGRLPEPDALSRAARRAGLTPLEAGVLRQAARRFEPARRTKASVSRETTKQAAGAERGARIAQALGVPPASVDLAVDGLVRKLRRL